MKLLFWVIFALVCVIFVLVLVAMHMRSKLNLLECRLKATEKEKDEYAAQVARLMNATQTVADNRREADAKVEELHHGDAVDNALGCLRDCSGEGCKACSS